MQPPHIFASSYFSSVFGINLDFTVSSLLALLTKVLAFLVQKVIESMGSREMLLSSSSERQRD
jgi:hypothetical protein